MENVKKGGFAMESDKMEKYLNKKDKYKSVETIDNVFKKELDRNKKSTDKYVKQMEKMLIRDDQGNVMEISDVQILESEDGVGTMTYTAMHPHGGRGRIGYNKGIKCPYCGMPIDLK